jgi:hypothetical protein
VFAKLRRTNDPYKQLKADIDLIRCARDLLLQLSLHVEVKKEWVKGHYNGPSRKLKHDLNDITDNLAGSFNTSKRATSHNPPVLQPLYEVELVHHNTMVTSQFQQIVNATMHTAPLQQYIAKSAGWHPSILEKIDWEAHKRAFCHHSRTQTSVLPNWLTGCITQKGKQIYNMAHPTCAPAATKLQKL